LRGFVLGWALLTPPRAPDHLLLVGVLPSLPETKPQIEAARGIAVHDIERHGLAKRVAPLEQTLDQARANSLPAIGREEMELAQIKAAYELGDLYPANRSLAVTDDSRLRLSIALAEPEPQAPLVPAADFR
jgi:hypothetical protein